MFTAIVYGLIVLTFVGVFTREVIAPASKAHCDRRWMIMATAINITQATAALGAGWLFAESFQQTSLWQLNDILNPITGGLVTFLIASFIAYWWHRAAHKSDWLWRVFHQMHHSPTRIEALTAFFIHPLDSVAATFITCFSAYIILGLDTASASVGLLIVSIYNIYQHSDTTSPHWLGYVVQRPEMHRVHHQYDHHADNYGLPIWDWLFGTWVNPKAYVTRCGFDEAKSQRIHDMLLMRDVHE